MRAVINTLINTFAPAFRWGILLGIVAFVVCISKKYDRKKTAYWSLLFAYIGAVIGETVLSGHLYLSRSYQLIPFGSIESIISLGRYSYIWQLVLNIIMFIPLGAFLYVGKKKRKTSIIIGAVASLLIEITEYITMTGIFYVDDLMMNTLGAFIGYAFARLLYKKNQ